MKDWTLIVPKEYIWLPESDITTYELALCLPIILRLAFNQYDQTSTINALPTEASRHFKVIED